MNAEIIAIVTVGVALAGVGVALAGVILASISRGAAGHQRVARMRSTNYAVRSGHSANAWRTWKG